MGSIPGEKQMPVAHRLSHITAQWCDRLLDRWPGDNDFGQLARIASFEFGPEPIVRPGLDLSIQRDLDVVAAENRATSRRERESTRVVRINDLGQWWRL